MWTPNPLVDDVEAGIVVSTPHTPTLHPPSLSPSLSPFARWAAHLETPLDALTGAPAVAEERLVLGARLAQPLHLRRVEQVVLLAQRVQLHRPIDVHRRLRRAFVRVGQFREAGVDAVGVYSDEKVSNRILKVRGCARGTTENVP
jgi:hypothetical protein